MATKARVEREQLDQKTHRATAAMFEESFREWDQERVLATTTENAPARVSRNSWDLKEAPNIETTVKAQAKKSTVDTAGKGDKLTTKAR